jgi:D-glycero-alpha-D-manno-heptose 1-phosphate guanylyltransferase
MEAIILAGGLGTRLRDVVPDLPKPMAPVAGRPFLEILLNSLALKGFNRVVLSLGYMAEKISTYFGSRFANIELCYAIEDYPLGTGGAVRLALSKCQNEHVYIFNGDTYLDLDIDKAEQLWQQYHRPIIVGCMVPDAKRYGRLMTHEGQVIGFSEKGTAGYHLINAGCYVFYRHQLDHFELNKSFSLEKDYLSYAVKQIRMPVFVANGVFIDIGVPEDYAKVQSLFSQMS